LAGDTYTPVIGLCAHIDAEPKGFASISAIEATIIRSQNPNIGETAGNSFRIFSGPSFSSRNLSLFAAPKRTLCMEIGKIDKKSTFLSETGKVPVFYKMTVMR
jgi:hypothetical protein